MLKCGTAAEKVTVRRLLDAPALVLSVCAVVWIVRIWATPFPGRVRAGDGAGPVLPRGRITDGGAIIVGAIIVGAIIVGAILVHGASGPPCTRILHRLRDREARRFDVREVSALLDELDRPFVRQEPFEYIRYGDAQTPVYR